MAARIASHRSCSLPPSAAATRDPRRPCARRAPARELPDGAVLTIDLQFGDSQIAISDELPDHGIVSPLTLGGTYGALHLEVEDADAVWERALGAGAEVFQPLHDAFWGERTGQFIDPFGHRWAVAQRVRDVPHDEVVRLAGEAYAAAGGG